MAETDSKLVHLSEDQILRLFHDALAGLYPVMNALAIMEDQRCPYDDYDDIADVLWRVMVGRSLAWKYGLATPPELQGYGCVRQETSGGYISVLDRRTGTSYFFTDFVGSPPQADPPFNIVRATDASGHSVELPYNSDLEFKWQQP
ncbi:MAG: hypothetical protein EDS66_17715 [Planctomycetota bacterium]|nr:MAG: hypothetical protein EDS66_17715 [Planctomycetota bacterium]